MRIKYADATHISCAYRLDSPQGSHAQGYFDDNEHGAGRSILQAIKDRSITRVAVYIVRYYGGVKLGKRRFQIVTTMATAALTAYQFRASARCQNRDGRALSQESISSSISALSGITEVDLLTEQDDSMSQDDNFATPTEGNPESDVEVSANEEPK